MKDEGHSLVEWVAYHRHVGFDNIVVYTNDCNDGTDDMLIRLEELGWVQHFRNDVPEDRKPQPNALTLGSKNPEVVDSEWILTMDADEFLSVKVGHGKVSDLVKKMDSAADAITITWRFFGSNDITEWNPGLVIETFTHAAPDIFRKGWGVKTLFRPFRDMKLGIHRPHIKKAKQEPSNAKLLFDQLWLNGSGKPMPDEFSLAGWRSTKPTLGYDWVELNHYAVKSYEAYLLRRLRGNVNNKADKYNAAYFALFDRNEEETTTIRRHVRGTKRKMEAILADPIMYELQEKALDYHENRVRMLREGGEYDPWLAELREAGRVPIDKLDEVLFVQHLPKEWQEKVKELQSNGVPDAEIAKMIAQTQTAKKGETRRELLKVAGQDPDSKLDAHQLRDRGNTGRDNLAGNPFMNTKAAAVLGVPLAQERTQKIALAAQAADEDDPRTSQLLRKTEYVKKVVSQVEDERPNARVKTNETTMQTNQSNAERPTLKKPTAHETPIVTLKQKRDNCEEPLVKHTGNSPNAGRKVLVSTMKNEGIYVLEWLAYYRSIGVDDFCIFSNDCTDGTNLILNRLDQMGVIRHFDNPLGPRMDPQRAAYSRANRMDWVRDADWVLIVDADEFLNIHVGDRSIDGLIENCGAPDAISVNWRLMGSSGIAHWEPEALVTERFTHGSTFHAPENGLVWGFKTLFRPESFDYFGVHRPRFDKKRDITPDLANWTNADGLPMGGRILEKGWRGSKDNVTGKSAQVNHYAIKSREEFLLKRLRGTANSKNKGRIDMDYFGKYDINTNHDNTILTEAIPSIMEAWLADDDLVVIVRACHDCARRVLDYQLDIPEFCDFVKTGKFEVTDAATT